jgi:hypothetical protein
MLRENRTEAQDNAIRIGDPFVNGGMEMCSAGWARTRSQGNANI